MDLDLVEGKAIAGAEMRRDLLNERLKFSLYPRKTSGEADFGRSFRVAGPETLQAHESCVTRCL
jgi:hypothetical protein